MTNKLRIGIPIIGGKGWLGGIAYIEVLIKAINMLPAGERPHIGLVINDTTVQELELHNHILPFVDTLYFVGNDPSTNLGYKQNISFFSNYLDLGKVVDFYFPVNSEVMPELCSGSWIPDFQHVYLSQFFSQEDLNNRNTRFGTVAEQAKLVVFSSIDSKKDFHKIFPSSHALTRVLSFHSLPEVDWYEPNPRKVQQAYNLPEQFLICCNQFWVHKNHGLLFEAFSRIIDSGKSIHLVCTGATTDYRNEIYFMHLQQLIESLGIRDHVHILGTIPRKDQIQLIRRSLAVIQPSLFEGWSTVVEDARALGKTIILSDLLVNYEQAPDHVHYFDRYDAISLQRAIEAVLPNLQPGPEPELEQYAREQSQELALAFARQFCAIAREAYDDFYLHKKATPLFTFGNKKTTTSPRSSMTSHEVVVATSIAPKEIVKQQAAIATWINLGISVLSVNNPDEITALKEYFPEVTFVRANRNANAVMGRPLIFFDDILAALAASNARVCGIINSDIHLITNTGFVEYIAREAAYSLVIGNRLDVESLNTLKGEFYQYGFDIFFFDRFLIEAFPPTEFCLGATWWDIWAPIAMLLKNIPVKKLVTPLAYHCIHENRWSKKEWEENCSRIINAINQNSFDLSGYSDLVLTIKEHSNLQNLQGIYSVLSSLLFEKIIRIDYAKSHEIQNNSPLTNLTSLTDNKQDTVILYPNSAYNLIENECCLPLISVITPSFNQGKYIEETIQSVLDQNFSKFEHIVIDGGSTDGTITVLQKYTHLKWTSEKDSGQSDALNKGFRKATGEIIAWINSDDRYEPDVFSNVAEFFAENPEKNIVMGNCNLVDEHGAVFDTVINRERSFPELSRYWVPRSIPTQPAVFFRKRLLDQYGLLDESLNYAMDYDLWMRFAKDNRFYHLNMTVANYRFHDAAKGGDQDWSKFVPEWSKVFLKYSGPLISIIIPCYNYAHYLPEAVSSVIGQTFHNYEIIIVNDGSTDNTIEVAEKLIAAYPDHGIRLITTPNSGNPAFPRNTGVRESHGKYVLFLDADDMIMPTFLEECVMILDETPAVSIVYTDQIYFDEMGNKVVNTYDYNLNELLKANFMSYCSLFLREAWDDVGGVPTDVGYEDWDFWIMCGLQGHYAQRIPKPLFCYRQHGTGRFQNDLVLRDQQLKAQIILKHSNAYGKETVRLAEETLAASKSKSESFRVVALISAHNEGDVIYQVIGDLISQGVAVYLINHCSTDNTVVEAAKWLGKGLIHIENFPQEAGYNLLNEKQYIWYEILRRKEELAAKLEADWFIHADADEFRESPWAGYSLSTAIQAVDRLGCNAIDFALLNFRPVDNAFVPGSDLRKALRHFEWGEDFNALQLKCWKKMGIPVDLKNSGGHNVDFEGRKVFPIKFVLRHYPIRSQAHGERKVFEERKQRFNDVERSVGWHVQYNDVRDRSHNFLRDPAALILYDHQTVRQAITGTETSSNPKADIAVSPQRPNVNQPTTTSSYTPPPDFIKQETSIRYHLIPLVGHSSASILQKLSSSQRLKGVLKRCYTED